MAGDEFPELLGQLKERSGLSYGVLGKRLHTSTSTLHRYVNGDAVPTDYAPVERFARACGATPEELVELHRRWVLADARRGQKAATAVPAEAEPRVETAVVARTARRRTVVLAGTAVAAVTAVLVSAALVAGLVPGDGADEHDRDAKQTAGAASRSVDERPAASGPAAAKSPSASPSGSPGGSPTVSASASRGGAVRDRATAPAVAVNPYKWENPCGPHFLVDRGPEQVPPPPAEQDARGWVNALGAVSAGQQMLALTVQGTGKATVVLDDLHVRVVEKSAPLDWNDFSMGVGCGGGVDTTAFEVDLDTGRPAVSPGAGQRDFPYKVSESDPEVFYVFANARAHTVRWYLELDWSSGDRKGTVRIDDKGQPFRTSGNVGRPAYDYPLGASEWGRNEYEPDIPG
ncbi:helix-turn-helix domain-containing protein [Streptomyces sp. S3(2020)]|uniref:helix-turn-helix domain-containing protein n=1 Tax=Streptomyces sp. S3(2020) TaxID=2732044 RepID=UPI001487D928|nr:helix-turn-helix domain-containing protein [Streptomyces sp. S3(2020)]